MKVSKASSTAEERELSGPADAFSDDGVDLSLIHWMLELSPRERLDAAQDMIDTVWLLRGSAST